MNFLNSLNRFVDTAFFSNVEISPSGYKILYSFRAVNDQHDKYIETLGIFDICSNLNETLGTGHCFKPKWSPQGKLFSIIKDQSLMIYETNTKKIMDDIKIDRKINDYAWGTDEKSLWLLSHTEYHDNGAEPIVVGQFNTPSYISHVDLTTGKITDLIFEEYGSISNIISYKDKLYYTLKDNDVYDFPGVIKEVDYENQIARRIDTSIDITVISLINFTQSGELIFIGYDQYPSNSCLEKKIYSLNLDDGKVELFLAPKKERGTCLEVKFTQNTAIVKENNGMKSVVYSNDDTLSKDVLIEKCISNISVSENGWVAFAVQDFNEHPQLSYCKLDQLQDIKNFKKINIYDHPVLSFKTNIINWESPDGKNIEGVLILPKEEKSPEKKPLVVITTGRSNSFTCAYLGGSDLLGGNDKFPYPISQFSDLGYYTLLANCRGTGYHDFEKISNMEESAMDGYC